jgi:hypothetical protein
MQQRIWDAVEQRGSRTAADPYGTCCYYLAIDVVIDLHLDLDVDVDVDNIVVIHHHHHDRAHTRHAPHRCADR